MVKVHLRQYLLPSDFKEFLHETHIMLINFILYFIKEKHFRQPFV